MGQISDLAPYLISISTWVTVLSSLLILVKQAEHRAAMTVTHILLTIIRVVLSSLHSLQLMVLVNPNVTRDSVRLEPLKAVC